MSSNSRLLSFSSCSGINSLLLCSVCMYICSKGSSKCGFLIGFRSDIVSLILPYSCPLLSICTAYSLFSYSGMGYVFLFYVFMCIYGASECYGYIGVLEQIRDCPFLGYDR